MNINEEVEVTRHHRPSEWVRAALLALFGGQPFLWLLCLLIVLSHHPASFAMFIDGFIATYLTCLLIILGLGVACGLGWLWHTLGRGEIVHVDQYGAYFRGGLFAKKRFTALPALSIAAPRVAGATKVTEVSPQVPRLGSLIADNLLIKEEEGQPLMLQGFRQDETARYGQWPGVVAITGMQNVGKSVTMVTLIIIALLQGARVVICDTHANKGRSLYKKVEILKGLVTFATTEQEVMRETSRYSAELARRKQGAEPTPYIIFYDELCSLLRTHDKDLRKLLVATMEQASQEGHGFGMHLVCAIHDMSDAGIGDSRLRGFWNAVYCHRMEAGQSKFIEAFKGRYGKQKTSMVIAGLPAGHVMLRDEYNEIEYLIMPPADSRDVLIARKKLLEARELPMPEQTANIPPAAFNRQLRLVSPRTEYLPSDADTENELKTVEVEKEGRKEGPTEKEALLSLKNRLKTESIDAILQSMGIQGGSRYTAAANALKQLRGGEGL